MKIVLITGMSGTGKTTMVAELRSRGYAAVDLDQDPFSIWKDAEPEPEYPDNAVRAGKDWIWDEQRIFELLFGRDTEILFLSGCASNMSKFYPYFSSIILLTAPEAVIVKRLQSRSVNAYGGTIEELERVLRLRQTIEPLLRRVADLEIDTSIPRRSVADTLLSFVLH